MKNEFIDFLNTKETLVPQELEIKILKNVEKDLLPVKPLALTSKFLALNFSAGILTLAICPQFGLGPAIPGHDITHYFMSIGVWACAIFCAAFYFVIAQTLSLAILSPREIKWIAKKRYSVLPGLVIASFLGLSMVGNSLTSSAHTMAFEPEFQVIWILAGIIITQILFNFRGISKAGLR